MKMPKKGQEQRQASEMLCVDMLVPKDQLLRKIDAAANVAYRWFLGYTMSQPLPHFATISYAFCHRFTAEVMEGVFRWVLEEVSRAGYLSPEAVFVDGTHIKANANLKKHVQKQIPVAAKRYQKQLDEEIEADRSAHGKKPLKKDDDDNKPPKEKTVIESTTDPQNQVLSYAITNREGYREYKSKSYVCKNCPVRERCTQSQQCTKTVTCHVWHDYIERAEDVRHSPLGKATYALRSQTIERVFADVKDVIHPIEG